MTSLILQTATRFLMPMILLFSAFLLLRGHNLPGGGFIGGLTAASAFSLYAFVFDAGEARQLLRIDPRALIGSGLVVALGSGCLSLVSGEPFLSGQWRSFEVGGPEKLKLGTPLVFDIGIFLVVLGSALAMVLAMAERD